MTNDKEKTPPPEKPDAEDLSPWNESEEELLDPQGWKRRLEAYRRVRGEEGDDAVPDGAPDGASSAGEGAEAPQIPPESPGETEEQPSGEKPGVAAGERPPVAPKPSAVAAEAVASAPRREAPVARHAWTPDPSFSATLTVLFVGLPLLLGALVLWADCNASAYLDEAAGKVVIRVLISEDAGDEEVAELLRIWRRSAKWSSVSTVSAERTLGETDRLDDWLAEDANRSVADLLPFSVDLKPRDVFDPHWRCEIEAVQLMELPEVGQVFFDAEGIETLQRLDAARRTLVLWLLATSGAAALLFAVAAGLVAQRLRAIRVYLARDPARAMAESWVLAAFACSGGILALAGAGLNWLLLYALTPLDPDFLRPVDAGVVVGAGVAGGLVALLLSRARLIPIRLIGSVLCAAALWLSASADGHALEGEASTTVGAVPEVPGDEPALPDLSMRLGAGLPVAAPSREERRDLIARIDERIEAKRSTISSLQECLERQQRNTRLDAHYLEEAQARRQEALQEYEMLAERANRRLTRLSSLHDALSPARWPPVVTVFAGPDRQSRNDLAVALLEHSANRAATLAGIEMPRIAAQRERLDALREEEARLRILHDFGDRPEDEIHAAIRQAREEMDLLMRQRILAQQEPGRLPPEIAEAPRPTPGPEQQMQDLMPNRVRVRFTPAVPLTSRHGMFLKLEQGSLIHAVAPGKVLHAAPLQGLGHTVIVEHENGLSSVYAFLGPELGVEKGDEVLDGQILGSADVIRDTGAGGIRFEVRDREGEIVDLDRLEGLSEQVLQKRLVGIDN